MCSLHDLLEFSRSDAIQIHVYLFPVNVQGCIQTFQDSTCKNKFAYLGC